ncbi:hypothetical protein T484DRAFT_1918414 [Baffinella frigidus]|nr:hypothetical protein T484DRAFT_1918414 [Cryptophyta sp. CCMP2293]
MGNSQSDALDASEGGDRFEALLGCCDGRKDLLNKPGRRKDKPGAGTVGGRAGAAMVKPHAAKVKMSMGDRTKEVEADSEEHAAMVWLRRERTSRGHVMVQELHREDLHPVQRAARDGDKHALHNLLLGPDGNKLANSQDLLGRTGLHFAAFRGNLEVAKMLVRAGASITTKALDGCTAIMAANHADQA